MKGAFYGETNIKPDIAIRSLGDSRSLRADGGVRRRPARWGSRYRYQSEPESGPGGTSARAGAVRPCLRHWRNSLRAARQQQGRNSDVDAVLLQLLKLSRSTPR